MFHISIYAVGKTNNKNKDISKIIRSAASNYFESGRPVRAVHDKRRRRNLTATRFLEKPFPFPDWFSPPLNPPLSFNLSLIFKRLFFFSFGSFLFFFSGRAKRLWREQDCFEKID